MNQNEMFRRRRLPHWDVPEAAYFVTTCLEGSISAQGLLEIENLRRSLKSRIPRDGQNQHELSRENAKLVFARFDWWLDRLPAVRLLADPQLAEIVVDAMFHFAGQRYDLLAYVVMPSHIHWVFQPLASWVDSLDKGKGTRSPRERIQHSLNRFTSQECNKIRQIVGSFWQRESYDHWIRDVDELERIIRYIEENPVKAGLIERPENWLFSSAFERNRRGIEFGEPLTRHRCGE